MSHKNTKCNIIFKTDQIKAQRKTFNHSVVTVRKDYLMHNIIFSNNFSSRSEVLKNIFLLWQCWRDHQYRIRGVEIYWRLLLFLLDSADGRGSNESWLTLSCNIMMFWSHFCAQSGLNNVLNVNLLISLLSSLSI